MVPPFKPMAPFWYYHLSMKTSFLLAIAWARRKGEIQALLAESSIQSFTRIRSPWGLILNSCLRLSQTFTLINLLIYQPFFPHGSHSYLTRVKLHTLDVFRTLSFSMAKIRLVRPHQDYLLYLQNGKGTTKFFTETIQIGFGLYTFLLWISEARFTWSHKVLFNLSSGSLCQSLTNVPLTEVCRAVI